MSSSRLPYIWDYEIDEPQLRRLLDGSLTLGRLDRRWAAVRLLEHAPYADIVRLLGFARLVAGWRDWRGAIRSESRRRGLDFLVEWLPKHHPELVDWQMIRWSEGPSVGRFLEELRQLGERLLLIA
jgi:hypothetical protein